MKFIMKMPVCELENCPVTNLDNNMCSKCSLFLNTCKPTTSADGYALGSEADCYLCPGCSHLNCPYSYL